VNAGDKDTQKQEQLKKWLSEPPEALLGVLLAVSATLLCACIDYFLQEDDL